MRKGERTLAEMVEEVERQHNVKRDYMVPPGAMTARIASPHEGEKGEALLNNIIEETREKQKRKRMIHAQPNVKGGIPQVGFEIQNRELHFALTPHAHGQLATRLDIPREYYRRLMLPENQDLWLRTVNQFLGQHRGKRMIRTLDGICRADLSDGYRDLDNYDLMKAIFPALNAAGCKIVSADITDNKLYIKAISPDLEGEVGRPGDHKIHHVNGGIVISNSEIGMGKLLVAGLMYVTVCANGLWTGTEFSKTHLGRRMGGDSDHAREFFSDDTKRLDDAAFFAKTADVVKGVLSHDAFTGNLARANGAAQAEPMKDPVGAVEVVKDRYGWTDEESKAIRNLVFTQAGEFGMSKWGLAQAITQHAQAEDLNYDRASELEQHAGQVIELPQSDWKKVAEAMAA